MICYWIRVYARLNEPIEKGRAVVDAFLKVLEESIF